VGLEVWFRLAKPHSLYPPIFDISTLRRPIVSSLRISE
jgi:hypothetical protein